MDIEPKKGIILKSNRKQCEAHDWGKSIRRQSDPSSFHIGIRKAERTAKGTGGRQKVNPPAPGGTFKEAKRGDRVTWTAGDINLEGRAYLARSNAHQVQN